MKTFLTVLLFSALLAGCETYRDPYAQEHTELRRKLQAIPTGQPISQADADVLASAYWQRFCSRCGAVYPVRDAGDRWAAEVVTGVIPVRTPDILIEKSTGIISSKGRQTVTNWSELW
jgi:hypothetical protein